MNEEKKKNKKKILTYYLILGACILIIAAITVTVIFAVNNSKNKLTIDQGNTNVDDGNDANDGNNVSNQTPDSDDDSAAVASKYEFIVPIDTVDVLNSYTFYKNNTLDCYHFHTGIDFSADVGTNVFACLDGTVESITTGDILDGTTITLTHENGLKSVYKFIDAKDGLSVGDTVSRGDVIGTVAEATGSEYKDGAHLHFEVYLNGSYVDPEDYLDISSK